MAARRPSSRFIIRALRWTLALVGLAAVSYGALVAVTWIQYGHVRPAALDEADPLLDRFMPEYDVAERHHVRVAAPAAMTLAAARDTDLQQSAIIRAIFRARELVLGTEPASVKQPRGLVADMTSLGWGILAEVPGRELVAGAVTQPWQANVVFRPIAPERFNEFREPGFVKIVWTLRVGPLGPNESMFRTETRVTTTDPAARRKFRWYWARFSPGNRPHPQYPARPGEDRGRAPGPATRDHDAAGPLKGPRTCASPPSSC